LPSQKPKPPKTGKKEDVATLWFHPCPNAQVHSMAGFPLLLCSHKGAYPAPQACRPKSRNPLKQAVTSLSKKKEDVATLWFHSCSNFSAPHGRLSAPALLKRELTPPHKLAVPKAETP